MPVIAADDADAAAAFRANHEAHVMGEYDDRTRDRPRRRPAIMREGACQRRAAAAMTGSLQHQVGEGRAPVVRAPGRIGAAVSSCDCHQLG